MDGLTTENYANPWEILSSETKMDTPWVTVKFHKVLNPSKQEGIYGVTYFKNLAIGILPLDENLNTWIVGQYRFPTDCYSWEMPEGGGKLDIDPLISAKRELKEETGIEAANWRLIQKLHLSNSSTDEEALLYVATGLSFGESEPEPSEQLIIKKIHFDEMYQMVCDGQITDAMTVAAALRVKLLLLEGKL